MPAAYRSIYVRFEANTQKLGSALKSIDSEATSVNQNLREINKGLKLDPGNAELMAKKFQLLGEGINNVNRRLEMLNRAREQATEDLGKLDKTSDEYKNLAAQIASLNKEIDRSNEKLKNFNRELANTASAIRDQMVSAVNALKDQFAGAVDIIKKAEAALLAFTAASAKTGAGFEESMSRVAATMRIDTATEEYEKLSAAAKEMGETTSYSAAQAALVLNTLAQAGYTADEAIERLPKTLNLAKAGGLDLASAAKIVTQSMASLQLEEEDLDRLLDEMAVTAQKSNTNIGELGDAIRTVGGTIDMADQSIETMLVELGMLANAGVSASEAGVHLRNVLLSLVKTDVQESLHELGVEVVDSTGNIRDLTEIMEDLKAATSDMASGELLATFYDLFNVRDLASINALLNGTGGAMQALRGELENAQGAASQMATTMQDNLTGDMIILKSVTEGLQIAITEKLNPALRNAAQESTKMMSSLTERVKNGDLGETFEKLGESINRLITSGLQNASKWLPMIIDFLVEVADHFDTILALYLSMQAFAKARVILTAVYELAAGINAMVIALKEAETAQIALNSAAAANPIGAVITGLSAAFAALTFGITKAAMALDVTGGKAAEMSQEVREATDNLHNMLDEMNSLNDARSRELHDIDTENARLSALASTVADLAEKQELTAGEYQSLHTYVDELNNAVPTLNLAFDDQANSLNMTREALMSLTKSYEAYQELQARISYGTDLKRQQVELQDTYDSLDRELHSKSLRKSYLEGLQRNLEDEAAQIAARAESKGTWTKEDKAALAAVRQQYEAVSEELETAKANYNALGEAHRLAGIALDEVTENLADNQEAIEECSGAAEEYLGTLKKQEEAEDKATKATQKSKTAYEDLKKATAAYKSELKDLLSVLQQVQEGTAYSTSQILDLIDKYPELASAIHQTADGYIIEAEAIENLTKARAKSMLTSIEEEIRAVSIELRDALSTSPHERDNAAIEDLRNELGQLKKTYDAYSAIAADIESGKMFSGSKPSSSSKSESSSSAKETDPYEEEIKARKEAAKAEQAELENQYKTEKISAEEYYRGLMDIAERYYAGIGELREEYLSTESKVYEGLKKAQEDELNNAQKLEKQLRAVKDAEDALHNAQTQRVSVYSGLAGHHAEVDTAAIEKAQATLSDKRFDIAETLLKNARYNGESLIERLTNIRSLLPDLSGLRLPTVSGGGVTNNEARTVTYNGGDISINIQGSVDQQTMPTLKADIEEAVRKGIDALLDEENADRMTGGI